MFAHGARVSLLLATTLALICFAGCASKSTQPAAAPEEPAPGPAESAAGDETPKPPAHVPLVGQLSATEKQRITQEALAGLRRIVISSDESIQLKQTVTRANVAYDALRHRLTDTGFVVVTATSQLSPDPSLAEQERFRIANNCKLAFLVAGRALPTERDDGQHLFQAEVRARVLNLTTCNDLATRDARRDGPPAVSELEAGRTALTAAASELAGYLVEELQRRWEATSLVRVALDLRNLDQPKDLDDVRLGLARQPGVYYVSLERWDRHARAATVEVLCSVDVRALLSSYIERLRVGRVQVAGGNQIGEVLKALPQL